MKPVRGVPLQSVDTIKMVGLAISPVGDAPAEVPQHTSNTLPIFNQQSEVKNEPQVS